MLMFHFFEGLKQIWEKIGNLSPTWPCDSGSSDDINCFIPLAGCHPWSLLTSVSDLGLDLIYFHFARLKLVLYMIGQRQPHK